jgi:hypothetical protein
MANTQSTFTLQNELDKVLPLGDINPVLANVAGYQLEPFITICNDVMQDIFGLPFPHKWNEVQLPLFYTNSFQQDYVLLNPNGSSFYNVEWLERGICIQMSSTAIPKPWGYVECARQLTQATGSLTQIGLWQNPTFLACSFPNYMLYYGTWGAANSGNPSLGNNPGPGSIYTAPLSAGSQPSNPITQIIDTNGNIQVVTTYGTCGNTQPTWPSAGAAPGTQTQDGTTVWTVADPNGIGVRILPVPSQSGVVFQFNLVGQQPAPRFTNLSQTLAPLPDKYEPYFRAGIIAQCYRYSPDPRVQAKFEKNYALWKNSLNDLRTVQDRELEENRFTPERGIMGSGRSRSRFIGPYWPFNYPY